MTRILKLVDKMCKYEMDLVVVWKIQSWHNFVHSQMDRWTDNQYNQYTLFHFIGEGYNNSILNNIIESHN